MTRTGISRGLTNSPLDCWFRRCGAVALYRARAPRIGRGPLVRAPASAARGPAPAPCIRRRRRSPAQQFLVRKHQNNPPA